MSSVAVLFFANSFMLLGWLVGVKRTIRVINFFAAFGYSQFLSIAKVSENLQWAYTRLSFLVIGKKQKCLWRGYTLYYYAKCAQQPVKLVFGVKQDERIQDNELNWHCWIELNDSPLFETPEVIEQYHRFIEFN